MTGDAVTGRNGSGERSGARALTLLAAPLNAQILRALRNGPRRQAELRHECEHPAQTTLRAQLKRLAEAGAIEKRRRNCFPGVLEYELSEAGHGLLEVADALDAWLQRSPGEPRRLGEKPSKAVVKALVEGWERRLLRALADAPLTLTELDRAIADLNYPSVERRLAAMRLAGLVEASAGEGRGTPYALTGWAQESIGAIAAAIRWEGRHGRSTID